MFACLARRKGRRRCRPLQGLFRSLRRFHKFEKDFCVVERKRIFRKKKVREKHERKETFRSPTKVAQLANGTRSLEKKKKITAEIPRKLRFSSTSQGETYLTELPVSKLPETIEENNSNDSGRGDPEEVKEEQTFRSIFCVFPSDTLWNKFTWLALWPICFLFFWTIPDCRSERWKKFYALTFLMCIIWIGIYCYSGTWLISAIGERSNR